MLEASIIRGELARVLASPVFANAPRMSRFLAFIVEETLAGNSERIKEYVIALEVFERDQDYDPHADSTVRTEASKLRARLDRYYRTVGQADSIVISIPKGSYIPAFDGGHQQTPSVPALAAEPGNQAIVVTNISRRWGVWASIIAASAMLVASTGLWLSRNHDRPALRTVPLTTMPGAEWSPTFSPDGSQIAFVWDGEKQENPDIYVKVIGVNGGLPLRLTSDPAPDIDPAWSPDGRWIAFRRITPVEHEIFLVSPLATGVEQKICALPCRGGHCSGRLWPNRLSWSSDSGFIAVSDAFSPHSPGRIFLLDVATREKRSLDLPSGREFVSSSNPAFSPDGSKLAFVAGETGSEHIYMQALDRWLRFLGQPRRLVQAGGYPAIDWTADSRNLIYSNGGFWRISAEGGPPERLPEPQRGDTLAIARQGKRIAYSAGSPLGSVVTNIYRARGQSGDVARLIASSYGGNSAQYSDDGGRIVFASGRGGTWELWICSSEGVNCFQLTSTGYAGSPRFSPDGQHVAFDSGKYGSWDIFVINSAGGPARRLTLEDSADSRPSWSRDGKWIYFGSDRSGEFQVWKIPAMGGIAGQVTRNGGFEAVEGHDGRAVYYVKRGEGGIWTVPVAGGEERLVLNQGEEGLWALGTQGIYLLSKGQVCAIDYFDLTKRSLSRIRTLPALNLTAMLGAGPEFAVSPDERSFLYGAVERNERDLMLLENFR